MTFKSLEKKIEKEYLDKGVNKETAKEWAEASTAQIGREMLGPKEFARRAAAGRKHKHRRA